MALSILVHIMVVAALIVSKPNPPLPLQNEQQVLKSYLVINQPKLEDAVLQPKPDIAPNTTEKPEVIEKVIAPLVSAELTQPTVAQSSDEDNTPPAQDTSKNIENDTANITVNNIIKDTPKTGTSAQRPETPNPQVTQNTQATHNINKRRIDTAVQNYHSMLNNQAVQRLAEQRAKEYQQEKDTEAPIIGPSSTLSQEQREAVKRKIEIDCASASKRGLSFVSGLFGGTIECRNHSDIQQYIDKHLNKHKDLQSKQ